MGASALNRGPPARQVRRLRRVACKWDERRLPRAHPREPGRVAGEEELVSSFEFLVSNGTPEGVPRYKARPRNRERSGFLGECLDAAVPVRTTVGSFDSGIRPRSG